MEVQAWLPRAAALRPEHPALIEPGGSRSYGQLYEAAIAGAGELAARGARPGARVAIALPGGFPFAQALHACLLLGAVAVPVDVRLAPAERELISAGCELVIGEPLRGRELPANGRLDRAHELAAPAVVIHTSGSTAAPKPVEISYGNLLWSALGSAVAIGLEPQERWLCAMPISHVGGLSILIRSAIYATTAVVHERFETEGVLEALREQDVTIVSLVATTLARLLDGGLEHPSALRCALTGGGPVRAALVARARGLGVPVCLTYGLTEASSQVTTTPLAEASAGGEPAPLTAGPPVFCTRVGIAADGEILVRGPTVAAGAPAPDGWLHTGDLGSLDDAGRLSVQGRKADTIVSGGENVAPAEVEAALESHPLVLEAGVFAREDARWGEAVIAVVVPRPGAQPHVEDLLRHCSGLLAPYKVPKHLELASAPLPRTPSGKLLRRELV